MLQSSNVLIFLIFSGQLFAFYSIFYIALAALFAICMQALMSTINNAEPKWKLTESLIGINPGLGYYFSLIEIISS